MRVSTVHVFTPDDCLLPFYRIHRVPQPPPLFYGRGMYRFETGQPTLVFASGGAGYSLSMAAVSVLARSIARGACADELTPYEDVGIARCLLAGGVALTEARRSDGWMRSIKIPKIAWPFGFSVSHSQHSQYTVSDRV
jgi:hypothetical protein